MSVSQGSAEPPGSGRLEYATRTDPALNYCLWEYTPPASAEDKFRSVNLLFRSFEAAGLGDGAYALVDAIRDAIGPFRTVFGIKLAKGRLAWEFYFYDYRRAGREVSMSRVLAALRPFAHCPVAVNERLPYFMFSLDVDEALVRGERRIDVVHMYIGNPGSTVSSGIAYALRADAATLENFYFFFDARTQLDEAAEKIVCSAHFDPATAIDDILLPQLRECDTICVANKQRHDCVYFSGVDVDQLLFFLRRFEYPDSLISFASANRESLDHLLFDVGVDYRAMRNGATPLGSGCYGVF